MIDSLDSDPHSLYSTRSWSVDAILILGKSESSLPDGVVIDPEREKTLLKINTTRGNGYSYN